MNKSPEAFRTISEVAEALDVPPHVLRFWETRFTQVKPVKRGGGRRYYRPEDVRLLRGIRGLLYDDGMTIKGVQKILREKGVRHVIALGTLPGAEAEAADGAAEATAPEPEGAAEPAARPADPAGPAAKPVAAKKPAPPERAGGPQADLFGAAAAEVLTAAESPGGAPAPARETSLKTLVAELEALRAVMVADPKH